MAYEALVRLSRRREGLTRARPARSLLGGVLRGWHARPTCGHIFGEAATILAAGGSNPPLSDVVFSHRRESMLPFCWALLQAGAFHRCELILCEKEDPQD